MFEELVRKPSFQHPALAQVWALRLPSDWTEETLRWSTSLHHITRRSAAATNTPRLTGFLDILFTLTLRFSRSETHLIKCWQSCPWICIRSLVNRRMRCGKLVFVFWMILQAHTTTSCPLCFLGNITFLMLLDTHVVKLNDLHQYLILL